MKYFLLLNQLILRRIVIVLMITQMICNAKCESLRFFLLNFQSQAYSQYRENISPYQSFRQSWVFIWERCYYSWKRFLPDLKILRISIYVHRVQNSHCIKHEQSISNFKNFQFQQMCLFYLLQRLPAVVKFRDPLLRFLQLVQRVLAWYLKESDLKTLNNLPIYHIVNKHTYWKDYVFLSELDTVRIFINLEDFNLDSQCSALFRLWDFSFDLSKLK